MELSHEKLTSGVPSARRRFHKSYINVDSRYRVKETRINEGEECDLESDPLMFKKNSNKLIIGHEDHPFVNGNKIKLNYIKSKAITLRSIIGKKDAFVIEPNSNVMTINYPHELPSNYDDNNLEVELVGIKGDNNCIGNIPINSINGKHKIHIKVGDHKASKDKFYIILPFTLNDDPYYLKKYNFKIIFHYISGIPIEYFTNEYHTVLDCDEDSYCIKLPKKALLSVCDGGNNITVTNINCILYGSENPNKYCIDLADTFNNIVTTRLVNTVFPKMHGQIKIDNKNFYWNNIDDGEKLYNIRITNGYYSIKELISKIKCQISENHQQTMNIKLDEPSGSLTFSSHKSFNLMQPIIKVSPEIIDKGVIEEAEEMNKEYILTIEHTDHHLKHGQYVTICGSIAHMGIPAHIINREHIITKIVNNNQYEITLSKNSFNLEKERINTKGGFGVSVNVPMLFRLRFDLEDTIGNILGFENIITDFKAEIINKNNCLKLVTDEYIYMIAEPLYTIKTIDPIKRAFAKIILTDKYGNTNSNLLYDTFVPSEKNYETPIREVSQLEIKFVLPNGDLYDFCGLEHSFVIEIVTVNDIPNKSGFSAQTGRNYNKRV